MSSDHQLDRQGAGGDTDMGGSHGSFNHGIVPVQDLLEAARYAIEWAERRIRTGDTNTKGRMFLTSLLTQVQALQRGAPDREIEQLVMRALEQNAADSCRLLKEVVSLSASPLAGSLGLPNRMSIGINGYDNSSSAMDWDMGGDQVSCPAAAPTYIPRTCGMPHPPT